MSVPTPPNANISVSSALTQVSAANVIQPLIVAITCLPGMNVRKTWPTAGQPAWDIDDDVCFIRLTLDEGSEVNRPRDRTYSGTGPMLNVTTTYLRVWNVHLLFYGPNSFDHARLTKSAIYMEWVAIRLSQFNLAAVMDISDPVRAPELFSGQWWERSDLKFQLNELVTEVSSISSMSSVEIDVYTEDTTVAQPIAAITPQ